MSRKCDFSGKAVQTGHRVSHSNIKSKHRFLPNLKKKRVWSENLGRSFSLKLSTAAIRVIDKIGLDAYAKRQGIKLK